jgi:hypothetical protein
MAAIGSMNASGQYVTLNLILQRHFVIMLV